MQTKASRSVLVGAAWTLPHEGQRLGNGNGSRAALSGRLAVFPVEREVESESLWKRLLVAPKGS